MRFAVVRFALAEFLLSLLFAIDSSSDMVDSIIHDCLELCCVPSIVSIIWFVCTIYVMLTGKQFWQTNIRRTVIFGDILGDCTYFLNVVSAI